MATPRFGARALLGRKELFYEGGQGARPLGFQGVFHNLGMYGLTIGESLALTSDLCNEIIQSDEDSVMRNLFAPPAAHRHRAARMVLNPAQCPTRGDRTQLDNLEFLVRGSRQYGIEPEPLDALLIWLGSNDCLQTVVQLELRDMPAAQDVGYDAARKYNLTLQEQFERDFTEMANRVARIKKQPHARVCRQYS